MFGGIVEKVLGGTDNSAQKEQIRANERSREFIEEQTGLAIRDAASLYPAGDQYRTDSYNAALKLLGDSVIPQMDYFQRGNVGAQQTLINAMPQYQNALFGYPIDYGQFQAVNLGLPDQSAFQVQMPEYGPARGPWAALGEEIAGRQAVTPQQPERPTVSGITPNMAKMLLGG